MTVSEKLAAVEAEALEAQHHQQRHATTSSQANAAGKRKHGADKPTHKTKKASRRRSTLSPEELAQLMGIQ